MTEAEMCNAWRAVQVHDHIFFLGIIEKKGDTNSRCIRYALQNYNYTVLVRCAGRNCVLRDLCVLVTDGRYARVARMCGRIWVLEECGDALSSTYGEQKWVILYTDVLFIIYRAVGFCFGMEKWSLIRVWLFWFMIYWRREDSWYCYIHWNKWLFTLLTHLQLVIKSYPVTGSISLNQIPVRSFRLKSVLMNIQNYMLLVHAKYANSNVQIWPLRILTNGFCSLVYLSLAFENVMIQMAQVNGIDFIRLLCDTRFIFCELAHFSQPNIHSFGERILH